MPRFWFIVADDKIGLIQLQKIGFMLNWRGASESEYPHYESMSNRMFDKYFHVLEDFAREDAGIERLSRSTCPS